MQNIQSMLKTALFKIGPAVICIIVIADAFLYGNIKQDKIIIADSQQEEETETHTANIVEDEIAEIESDEIYLVMGTMDKKEPSEESVDAETQTEAFTPVISYTEEDYNNFLRIVEAEATDADVLSKIMVANVIINRVKSPRFPNTITEVIFQGNGEQFSPLYDGRFYTVTVKDATVEAVNRALAGEDYSQGATFFAAEYVVTPDCWHSRTLIRLFEYGGHIFFKEY